MDDNWQWVKNLRVYNIYFGFSQFDLTCDCIEKSYKIAIKYIKKEIKYTSEYKKKQIINKCDEKMCGLSFI